MTDSNPPDSPPPEPTDRLEPLSEGKDTREAKTVTSLIDEPPTVCEVPGGAA